MNRVISLLVQPQAALGELRPDSGGVYVAITQSGNLTWSVPEEVVGGADLRVESDGFEVVTQRCILPLGGGKLELVADPLVLVPAAVRIEGDKFARGDAQWYWKGSTDFRLVEVVLNNGPINHILDDRKEAGANLVRVLSMKANNTGWELDPRGESYWDALKETIKRVHSAGLLVELTVFADTKRMMIAPSDQQNHWKAVQGVGADFLELVNEDKHATQSLNSSSFHKLSSTPTSHGSGLSDVPPVKPFWDYATYHARRSGGLGKVIANYNYMCSFEYWPVPCPIVPEETLKPASYGFDPNVARALGRQARYGSGGTFHHDAWNEPRVWTGAERACAEAFYKELE